MAVVHNSKILEFLELVGRLKVTSLFRMFLSFCDCIFQRNDYYSIDIITALQKDRLGVVRHRRM